MSGNPCANRHNHLWGSPRFSPIFQMRKLRHKRGKITCSKSHIQKVAALTVESSLTDGSAQVLTFCYFLEGVFRILSHPLDLRFSVKEIRDHCFHFTKDEGLVQSGILIQIGTGAGIPGFWHLVSSDFLSTVLGAFSYKVLLFYFGANIQGLFDLRQVTQPL